MASVSFKGSNGQHDVITGTYGHPIYSLDRCDSVDLGSLTEGERVRAADGWATAEMMARWWGRAIVLNLEVDADHRYFVGTSGVEGHNARGPRCNLTNTKRGPHGDVYSGRTTGYGNPVRGFSSA
jgi:hypothetical protein